MQRDAREADDDRDMKRDYSLLGPSGKAAVETGLAAAEWYHTDIPRKEMKALMQRSDEPPSATPSSGSAAWRSSPGSASISGAPGSAVPFFLAYGVLYGSASDSRWHECGHGTAFKTRWMNDAVYQIACFMIMRNPVTWRWSHTRHHTDTVIVGRDPEIAVMRPPDLLRLVLNFFGILDVWHAHASIWSATLSASSARRKRPSFPRWSSRRRSASPASGWRSISRRSPLLSAMGSILPLVLIGLPRLYGAWHHVLTGLLQHGGLADNVIDHRLNSRTV